MSNCRSDIQHEDIISIAEHIISLLENYAIDHQYGHLQNVFQYLENFQSSNYNFLDINSINNDEENYVYIFKIHNTYYQFNQCDTGSMIISARSMVITMRNATDFLKSVKNKAENYSFKYLQELITSNFNCIIEKYINLHKFMKIIERKPICLIDAIMYFNNASCVFNQKFEILKTFLCVDNVMHVYYFDVERDFAKTLIAKLCIPQLRIDANVDPHITFKPTVQHQSTIFSPAYASFFNDTGHGLINGCVSKVMAADCHSHSCSSAATHGYTLRGTSTQHCWPQDYCKVPVVGATHPLLQSHHHGYGHLANDHHHHSDPHHHHSDPHYHHDPHYHIDSHHHHDPHHHHSDPHYHHDPHYHIDSHHHHDPHCHAPGTHHTSNSCAHNHHTSYYDSTGCHITVASPACPTTHVHSTSHSIKPCAQGSTVGKTVTITSDDCGSIQCYSDCYEYDPHNCANTYVFNPSFCVHTHTYNSTTNLHTHVYNTGSCVHTIIYDPSLCVHTHVYDPNKCCHKYVYDAYHCYHDVLHHSACDHPIHLHTHDISHSSHTIVYDVSGCIYDYVKEDCVHKHLYDSSGCEYTITFDDNNMDHNIVFVPQLCEHSIRYDYDCSLCIHTYETDACKHSVVLDISDCSNNYLVEMSGCIYKHVYDTSECVYTTQFNDSVDVSNNVNIIHEQTVIQDSSDCSLNSIFDPSLNTYTSIDNYSYEDTLILDSSDCSLNSIYDPSLNTLTTSVLAIYEQTYTIDTSHCNIISKFDPSLNAVTDVSDTIINSKHDNYDSEHMTMDISYNPDTCIRTHTYDVTLCSDDYKYDISGSEHHMVYNIITSYNEITYDPSMCHMTEVIVGEDTHVIDYVNLENNIHIEFDETNTIINKTYDASLNKHTHKYSIIHTTAKTFNTISQDKGHLIIDSSGCGIDMKYDISENTTKVILDLSQCTLDVSGYEYTITGTKYSHDITIDVSAQVIESYDSSHNIQSYLFTTTGNTDISFSTIVDSSTYYYTLDSSGCEIETVYDVSNCKHIITVDPSLCDVSGINVGTDISSYTFVGSGYVHDIKCVGTNVDVSGNIYTFDLSTNSLTTDSLTHDTSWCHINTFDISGINLVSTYDTSLCTHVFLIDPSLCDVSENTDVSGYTFDVSGCKHSIVYNDNVTVTIDVSSYTFSIDSSTNQTSDLVYMNEYTNIYKYDVSANVLDHTIKYDPSLCVHTTVYNDLSCNLVSTTDASGNVTHKYSIPDISEIYHEFIYDPSLCTFDTSYNSTTKMTHDTLTVPYATEKTVHDPMWCLVTHNHDISGCLNSFLHNEPLTVLDTSYCTHKHVFKSGETGTLVFDKTQHKLMKLHDAWKCTYTYIYDTSGCIHTLVFDLKTRTWNHKYNPDLCSHQHVYDISNCKWAYVYDVSDNAYATIYDVSSCSHDTTKCWIPKHTVYNPYIHSFPFIPHWKYGHHICPDAHCHTHTHTHKPHIYGYKYMCGKVTYIHKHIGATSHTVCEPTKDHGFLHPDNAIIYRNHPHNHATTACDSKTFDYYSKVIDPVYEDHIVKHSDHKNWEGFTKVTYNLFDSDLISVTNQTEFIMYLGNEYVRFTEYDLTTDVFYTKLTSYIMRLYSIINTDFKQYQATKDMLCNNVFNRAKLVLFQRIYREYLSMIDIMETDIENIQGLASNNENIGMSVNTANKSIMSSTCARFSKLYTDIEKSVLLSSNGDKFDIYYIDYSNKLALFATNYNMTVTQFVVAGKIIKLVICLDSATIVLEEFTESYTHAMLRTLCRNNLINIAMLRVNMGLNLKNIEDLLKKCY